MLMSKSHWFALDLARVKYDVQTALDFQIAAFPFGFVFISNKTANGKWQILKVI